MQTTEQKLREDVQFILNWMNENRPMMAGLGGPIMMMRQALEKGLDLPTDTKNDDTKNDDSFGEFKNAVDAQGMDLISGFMQVATDADLVVSPLVFGREKNQVGFSIIVNNENNHYLNKYQLMLTKRHDSK